MSSFVIWFLDMKNKKPSHYLDEKVETLRIIAETITIMNMSAYIILTNHHTPGIT